MVGWPGKIPALSIKFKADPPPRIVCDFQSSDSDKLLTDNGNQPNNEFDNNSSYNVAKGNSSNAIEILEDRHWTVEMFHGPELTNVTIQVSFGLSGKQIYCKILLTFIACLLILGLLNEDDFIFRKQEVNRYPKELLIRHTVIVF